MREVLAGRLKWEQRGEGIRVIIPARICKRSIWKQLRKHGLFRSSFALLCLLLVGFFVPSSGFRHAIYILIPFWLFMFAGGVFLILYTRRTTLTLDRTSFEISLSELGIRDGMPKRFSTDRIRNLRFVRFAPAADIRNDLRMDEMQFDLNGLTQAFGAGLDEQESIALIQRITVVYPTPTFPAEGQVNKSF
jgi:hypothetical protein